MCKNLIGEFCCCLNRTIHESKTRCKHDIGTFLLNHSFDNGYRVSLRNTLLVDRFGPGERLYHEPGLVMGMSPTQIPYRPDIDKTDREHLLGLPWNPGFLLFSGCENHSERSDNEKH